MPPQSPQSARSTRPLHASDIPIARHPRRWPAFLSITPTPLPAVLDRPGAWMRALLRRAAPLLAVASLLDALTHLAAGLVPTALGRVVDSGLDRGLSADLAPVCSPWRRSASSAR